MLRTKSISAYCVLILFLVTLPALARDEPQPPTAAATPFEVASRYFNEVYNGNKFVLIKTLFSPDYEHTSSDGSVSKGTERLVKSITFLKQSFPGLRMSIQHHADNGEMTMMVVRYDAGMPKFAARSVRNERITFDETFVFWVRDGQIIRGQSYGPGAIVAAKMAGFDGDFIKVVRVLSQAAEADAKAATNASE